MKRELLGAAWNDARAFEKIEAGLPTSLLLGFREMAGARAEWKDVLEVVAITERTLARRRTEGRLKPEESDRFYRLVDLYALAADVMGSVEEAQEWMCTPKAALADRSPLQSARNVAGARRVEELLKRIEYGVYG